MRGLQAFQAKVPAEVAGMPTSIRRTFEVTVDRWDEVSKNWSSKKHCTYKTTIAQVEIPSSAPSSSQLPEALYAQLETMLVKPPVPESLMKKAQNVKSGSGPSVEQTLFTSTKVGHFDDYRGFKSKLYALYTESSRGGSKDEADEQVSLGTFYSESPLQDEPCALDSMLPPFPPTLFKRKLGLALTDEEHRTRVVMLEDWMRAVVLKLPTLPRQCRSMVAKFLELTHLGTIETSAKADSTGAGACNREARPLFQPPPPLPSPAVSSSKTGTGTTDGGSHSTDKSNSNDSGSGGESGRGGGGNNDDDDVNMRIRQKADAMLSEGLIDSREHAMMLHPIRPLLPASAPAAKASSSSRPATNLLAPSAKLMSRLGSLAGLARKAKGNAHPATIPEDALLSDDKQQQESAATERDSGGERDDDTGSVTSAISELSMATDWHGMQHAGLKRCLVPENGRPRRWLDDTAEQPLLLAGGGCGPLPLFVRVYRSELVAKRDGGSKRHVGYRLVLRLHGVYVRDEEEGDGVGEGEAHAEVGAGEIDDGHDSDDDHHHEFSDLREIEVTRTSAFEGFRQLSERLASLGAVVPDPLAVGVSAVFPKPQSSLSALQGGMSETALRERCRQLHNWALCLFRALPSLPETAREAALDWFGLDVQDPRVALSASRLVMHFALLRSPLPGSCATLLSPVAMHLLSLPLDPALDIQRPEDGGEGEGEGEGEGGGGGEAAVTSAQSIRSRREASARRLSAEDFEAWGVSCAWSHLSVASIRIDPKRSAEDVTHVPLTVTLSCGPRPLDWEHSDIRFAGYDSPQFILPPLRSEEHALRSLPELILSRSLRELCDLRSALEDLAKKPTQPLLKESSAGGATAVPGMHNSPFPNIGCLLKPQLQQQQGEVALCVAELSRWLGALVRNTFCLPPDMQAFVETFFFGEEGGDPSQRGAATYYHSLMVRQRGGSWLLLPPRAVNASKTAGGAHESSVSAAEAAAAAAGLGQDSGTKSAKTNHNACCSLS